MTTNGHGGGIKLYLSSFRMGERFDDLVAILGSGARVAVVGNALDFIPADARRAYAGTGFDAERVFIERGLDAFDLDLRSYFEAPLTLADALADVRLVWAVGAGPDIEGIELMDDPAVVAEGYDTAVVREGLGLVDFTIVPHYHSDHAEAEAAGQAAAFRQERRLPFRTLRDGEVIVV